MPRRSAGHRRGPARHRRTRPVRDLLGAPRARRHGGRRRFAQPETVLQAVARAAGQSPGGLRSRHLRPAGRFSGRLLPPQHRGIRRRGRERRGDPGDPRGNCRRHVRRRARPDPRGGPARDSRRHRLLFAPRIGRGAVTRNGQAGARPHPHPAEEAGGHGRTLRDDSHHRGGEVQRRDFAALRRTLRDERFGLGDERHHQPEPRDGQPALSPLCGPLPDGEEVPRALRRGVPRRGPCARLHAGGRPAGGEGVGAAPAAGRPLDADAEGHVLPATPGPGHQPGVDVNEDRGLRRRPGTRGPGNPAHERGTRAVRRAADHGAVRDAAGRRPAHAR